MSSAAITLCVVSHPVFIVVSAYFVIDSVQKLLDKPSYKIMKLSDKCVCRKPGFCDTVPPPHLRGMQRPSPKHHVKAD
jgi:hypothetical protein